MRRIVECEAQGPPRALRVLKSNVCLCLKRVLAARGNLVQRFTINTLFTIVLQHKLKKSLQSTHSCAAFFYYYSVAYRQFGQNKHSFIDGEVLVPLSTI